MNDDEPILVELRKISAWADMQRKLSKWSLIFLAVFIPGMIAFVAVMEHRLKASIKTSTIPEKPDWYDVDRNVRLCDFEEAIRIGEELITKSPHSPDAHRRLATAYLAAGKLKEARAQCAEAVRLFPSEEYEKALIALDKRIKRESSQPIAPANASEPRR